MIATSSEKRKELSSLSKKLTLALAAFTRGAHGAFRMPERDQRRLALDRLGGCLRLAEPSQAHSGRRPGSRGRKSGRWVTLTLADEIDVRQVPQLAVRRRRIRTFSS